MKLVLQAGRMVVTGPTFRGSELKLMNITEGLLGASELRVCWLIERFPPQTDSLLKLIMSGSMLARNGAEVSEIELQAEN